MKNQFKQMTNNYTAMGKELSDDEGSNEPTINEEVDLDDSIADDDIHDGEDDEIASMPSFDANDNNMIGASDISDEENEYLSQDTSEYDSDENFGADSDDNVDENEQRMGHIKYKQEGGSRNNADEFDAEFVETMFQNFKYDVNTQFVTQHHPECNSINSDEVTRLCQVVRDADGYIIDPLHTTIPIMTKYERARVIGQRAKQIESGCTPFVSVPDKVISGLLIAEIELREKKIPFIIKRPIPNGMFEYWKISDLELIDI